MSKQNQSLPYASEHQHASATRRTSLKIVPHHMLWLLIIAAPVSCWCQLVGAQIALPPGGDYNADGIVNAPDYSVWRDFVGDPGAALFADGDGNGVVDANDYFIWRMNFGLSLSLPPISQSGEGVLNLDREQRCALSPCASAGESGPRLAVDFVRDTNARPVLDAEGRWQFSVSIVPDTDLFRDLDGDTPDKGFGGSTAIELGLEVHDEHGSLNTTVSSLSVIASGEDFQNDPNWDGRAPAMLGVENPGLSPFGGLIDSQGVDAVGHQIDAFVGTIFFNSDNDGQGHELFTFSAGKPATLADFGGLTIEVDVEGAYGGFYRLAQGRSIFDRPATDGFFFATIAAGDVNLDGEVDYRDLSALDASLGSPGIWTEGDLTGDGKVDAQDREILLEALEVPEPSTLFSLLTVSGLLFSLGRFR